MKLLDPLRQTSHLARFCSVALAPVNQAASLVPAMRPLNDRVASHLRSRKIDHHEKVEGSPGERLPPDFFRARGQLFAKSTC